MPPALTFTQLEVGARFHFVRSPEPKPLPIAYYEKTGERTFDVVWDDGDRFACGRVGIGDNPVRRV